MIARRLIWISVLAAALLVVHASHAAAQERASAVSSDEQIELNNEGVRAIIDEDYDRAIELFEKSIGLGPSNVAYLNLGRALQKKGRCAEAREAFERALTAPVVADPPAAFVDEKIVEYSNELEQTCEQEPAPENPEGTASDEGSGASKESGQEMIQEPGASDEAGRGRWWSGVALTSGGLIASGVGVTLHFVARSERSRVLEPEVDAQGNVTSVTQREAAEIEARANRLDTYSLATVGVGAVLTGIGTYLLFSRRTDDTRVSLDWVPVRQGALIRWTTRF